MQIITGTSRRTRSKSYMLSLTEYVWKFRNNALWDTGQHALLDCFVVSTCFIVRLPGLMWLSMRVALASVMPIAHQRHIQSLQPTL